MAHKKCNELFTFFFFTSRVLLWWIEPQTSPKVMFGGTTQIKFFRGDYLFPPSIDIMIYTFITKPCCLNKMEVQIIESKLNSSLHSIAKGYFKRFFIVSFVFLLTQVFRALRISNYFPRHVYSSHLMYAMQLILNI